MDAFFEIGFGGVWDVAAGALVVAEAGGRVMDPAGGTLGLMARRVLAATPAIAPAIAQVLSECGHSEQEPPPPPAGGVPPV